MAEGLVLGRELGKALVEVFGLPRETVEVQVRCNAQGMATVTATVLVRDPAGRQMVEAIQRYHLVEAKGDADG